MPKKKLERNGRVKVRKDSGEITDIARYKMEKFRGREVAEGDVVHHKDGDPKNNSLENLEIVSEREHRRLHQTDAEIPEFKAERIRKMAREMESIDVEYLSEFSGEPVEKIEKLFSHVLEN